MNCILYTIILEAFLDRKLFCETSHFLECTENIFFPLPRLLWRIHQTTESPDNPHFDVPNGGSLRNQLFDVFVTAGVLKGKTEKKMYLHNTLTCLLSKYTHLTFWDIFVILLTLFAAYSLNFFTIFFQSTHLWYVLPTLFLV